jgi:hypothetical protein
VTRRDRIVGIVAGCWLIGQMVTVSIAAAEFSSWQDVSSAECLCAHDANAACPMHHAATSGQKTCALRAAAPVDGLVVMSFLNVAGCLTATNADLVDSPAARVPWPEASNPASQFVPPDPPPPRA